MKVTFLIGNGFDRAVSIGDRFIFDGNTSDTSYAGLKNCLSYFGFAKSELEKNFLVQNLDYSAWEDLLIEKFKDVDSKEGMNIFMKNKEQAIGYMMEAFRLWELQFDDSFLNCIYREFENSVTDFYSRMSKDNQTKLIAALTERKLADHRITLEFLTFNGTTVLNKLVKRLDNSGCKVNIGGEEYKINTGIKVHHVHSDIFNDKEYMSKAFGTTIEEDLQSPYIQISDTGLLKTNIQFENWISDTDLFVVHGLSLGNCDKKYRIWVTNRIGEGAVLIDFPRRGKREKYSQTQNEREALFGFNSLTCDRIIVELNDLFRTGNKGAVIFNF